MFVRDAGGGTESASMLIERGVRAVIRGTYMSHLAEEKFQEARVPVVPKDEVALKVVDDFAVMDPKKFDAAIERWKVVDGADGKEKNVEWFQGIVDDYKSRAAAGVPEFHEGGELRNDRRVDSNSARSDTVEWFP